MTPTTDDNDRYNETYREDREDEVHPVMVIIFIIASLLIGTLAFWIVFVK